MGRVEMYRGYVQELLGRYAQRYPAWAKDDIVLACHAPYKRPYTGFAVG